MDCGRSWELLKHISNDLIPCSSLHTRTASLLDSLLDSLLLEYLLSARHLFVAMEGDGEVVLRVGA